MPSQSTLPADSARSAFLENMTDSREILPIAAKLPVSVSALNKAAVQAFSRAERSGMTIVLKQ
jgi:hypothetical protein